MDSALHELQRCHPNLDRMMCETLLKLHEQGKLSKFQDMLEESRDSVPPPDCILRDAITIERVEENVVLG